MKGFWNVLSGLREAERSDSVGDLMLTFQQEFYAARRAAGRLGGVLVEIARTTNERETYDKVVAALAGTLREKGHETLYLVPPFAGTVSSPDGTTNTQSGDDA